MTNRTNFGWNIALWASQILLAAAFGLVGFMKTTMPIAELAHMFVWPGQVPEALVRFIGLAELSGAVGLVLPALTRIAPVLTPVAALSLIVLLACASVYDVAHGVFHSLGLIVVFVLMAAFIAWGRLRKVVIGARGGERSAAPQS